MLINSCHKFLLISFFIFSFSFHAFSFFGIIVFLVFLSEISVFLVSVLMNCFYYNMIHAIKFATKMLNFHDTLFKCCMSMPFKSWKLCFPCFCVDKALNWWGLFGIPKPVFLNVKICWNFKKSLFVSEP